MPSDNLNAILEQVCKEKGIAKQILIEAIEEAILHAAKNLFGEERELEAKFNPETGQIELFQYMKVVEDIENDMKELVISDAQKVDPEAQVDDELGFQIFYLQEESRRRRRIKNTKIF